MAFLNVVWMNLHLELVLTITPVVIGAVDRGNNLCEIKVPEISYRTVTFKKSYNSYECWLIGYYQHCEYRTRFTTASRVVSETVLKTRFVCCPGYKSVAGSQACEACSAGKFGDKCESVCACPETAYPACDHVEGNCTCRPGWTGENCNQTCSAGRFGEKCESVCACPETAYPTCDRVAGNCTCQPGWTGENCNQKCPKWKYGEMCLKTCNCWRNKTSYCGAKNGTCYCLPGWLGLFCEMQDPSFERMNIAISMTVQNAIAVAVVVVVVVLVLGLTISLFARRRRGGPISKVLDHIKSFWFHKHVAKNDHVGQNNPEDSVRDQNQLKGTDVEKVNTYELAWDNDTHSTVHDCEQVYENQSFVNVRQSREEGIYNTTWRNDNVLKPDKNPITSSKNYDHIVLKPEAVYANSIDEDPYDVALHNKPSGTELRINPTYDTLCQNDNI